MGLPRPWTMESQYVLLSLTSNRHLTLAASARWQRACGFRRSCDYAHAIAYARDASLHRQLGCQRHRKDTCDMASAGQHRQVRNPSLRHIQVRYELNPPTSL